LLKKASGEAGLAFLKKCEEFLGGSGPLLVKVEQANWLFEKPLQKQSGMPCF
jgi:hypothetical protein